MLLLRLCYIAIALTYFLSLKKGTFEIRIHVPHKVFFVPHVETFHWKVISLETVSKEFSINFALL